MFPYHLSLRSLAVCRSCRANQFSFSGQSGPSSLASRDAFAKTPLPLRSFAVRQGFWASFVSQGLDYAWMGGRIMGFHRVHPERLEGNLGTPSPFRDQG